MVARTLSPKQLRFIEEYLLDGNVTAAAKRAGYSPKSARVVGQETLRNPAVRAALRLRQDAEAARLQVSRTKAVEGILAAIAMAKEQGDPAAMVRGWAEIGRLFDFYSPQQHRVEVTTQPDDLEASFARMSDAELMKIVSAGAAAV